MRPRTLRRSITIAVACVVLGVGVAWLFAHFGRELPRQNAPTKGPEPGAASVQGSDPSSSIETTVEASQRTPVDSPSTFEEIRVEVFDSIGEPLGACHVDAFAHVPAADAQGVRLDSVQSPAAIESVDSDDRATHVRTFLCASDAERVTFDVSCPRFDSQRIVRPMAFARRGTRVVLYAQGARLMRGRLLDSAGEPWSREALERWFGRANHMRRTELLVTRRSGVDSLPYSSAAGVDFDTAEFVASIASNFEGQIVLIDGTRQAASVHWRIGDPDPELVFDPWPDLDLRARLSVRLEPAPITPVSWRVRRISPWTTEPLIDVPSREDARGDGPTWVSDSIPGGVYVIRCTRDDEDGEILVSRSIVLRPRDDIDLVLPAREDVDVVIALANDDPFTAHLEAGASIDFALQGDGGDEGGLATLAFERDGGARLDGRLPVGSWWITDATWSAHVTVAQDGTVAPNAVMFARSVSAHFRVGPLSRRSRDGEGQFVRAVLHSVDGTFVNFVFTTGPVDAAGFMRVELNLPPFPTRIHFTSASFAEPTIVDVDPRTVDDRVIDVVLR